MRYIGHSRKAPNLGNECENAISTCWCMFKITYKNKQFPLVHSYFANNQERNNDKKNHISLPFD